MPDFRESRLYRTSLGEQSDWPDGPERRRLATPLDRLREHAARIAARIAADLPDFTTHDVTHIDALWHTADQIAPADYRLTPTEGFVFGGAALLHDLGLAAVAYVDGATSLTTGPEWDDALFQSVSRELEHPASREELEHASPEARRAAVQQQLRRLHAARAQEIATASLNGPEGPLWLIEDTDLRLDAGWSIGAIAASHWWDPSALTPAFANRGAPLKDFPPGWTIDPLRLACLLRLADAAHLDGTRARMLAQAIQRPARESEPHWTFQRLLRPVRREGDQLVFESVRPFRRDEVEAWWLCLDTLRAADRELRAVDALLADTRSGFRFAARSVAGVDHPARLAERIPTDGWAPVDARLHVSDLPALVERLGGRQLYGDDPDVPLREILQNAQDAVRARAVYREEEPLGSVLVSESADDEGPWLAVADDGVGMPIGTLTGSLLDFGVSGWQSGELADRLPGLLARGFRPTGRFGIGFAAVFMGSRRVEVVSRALDASRAETNVLEFLHGSNGRPLLRLADAKEQRARPGTVVRTWLSAVPERPERTAWDKSSLDDLGARVAWLCPATETDLHVQQSSGTRCVARAGDWRELDGTALLQRIAGVSELSSFDTLSRTAARRMRPVHADDGSVLGRAALIPVVGSQDQVGVMTVGGLRATRLEHLAGVLLGHTPNLARNQAVPRAGKAALNRWATEQRDLLRDLSLGYEDGVRCAAMLLQLGVDPSWLPICRTANGELSFVELVMWLAPRREVLMFDDVYEAEDLSTQQREDLEPADGVIVSPRVNDAPPEWFARASDDGFENELPERIADTIRLAVSVAWDHTYWEWEGEEPRSIGTADEREVATGYYTGFERADPDSPEWQEQFDEAPVQVIVEPVRFGLPPQPSGDSESGEQGRSSA